MLVTNIYTMTRWNHTHAALQQAALELFSQYGFDATSTAAVAAKAGVTEMTLFRHFPTKAALVLADPFDPAIAEAVRARPADEPPLLAAVAAVRSTWQQLPPESVSELRLRLRILVDAKVQPDNAETVAALSDALCDRGVAPAAAQVAAAAVVTGLTAALSHWAVSGQGTLDDALTIALDTLSGQ